MDPLPSPSARRGDSGYHTFSVIPGRSGGEGNPHRCPDRRHRFFSLPLVGRARVGVLAPHLHRLSLTPPPPPPPHKGEESSLSADLRIIKLISGKPEMGGEESLSRSCGSCGPESRSAPPERLDQGCDTSPDTLSGHPRAGGDP